MTNLVHRLFRDEEHAKTTIAVYAVCSSVLGSAVLLGMLWLR